MSDCCKVKRDEAWHLANQLGKTCHGGAKVTLPGIDDAVIGQSIQHILKRRWRAADLNLLGFHVPPFGQLAPASD
jgi:hypothetical protein